MEFLFPILVFVSKW